MQNVPPGSLGYQNHYYLGVRTSLTGTDKYNLGPCEYYSDVLSADDIYYRVYHRKVPSPEKQGCPWNGQ